MNFNAKYYTLGLGTGILIMCLVFYCVYSFDIKPNYPKKHEDLQQEATLPTDLDELIPPIDSKAETDESGERDIAPPSEGNTLTPNEKADDIQAPEDDEPPVEASLEIQQEVAPIMEAAPQKTTDAEASPPDGNGGGSSDGPIVIIFSSGMSALEYANILQERGVVDNAESFMNFVSQKNLSRRLNTGEFTFDRDSDYDEVLSIICKGYRR